MTSYDPRLEMHFATDPDVENDVGRWLLELRRLALMARYMELDPTTPTGDLHAVYDEQRRLTAPLVNVQAARMGIRQPSPKPGRIVEKAVLDYVRSDLGRSLDCTRWTGPRMAEATDDCIRVFVVHENRLRDMYFDCLRQGLTPQRPRV